MGSPPEKNRLSEKSPFEIPEPSSDPSLAVATCDDEATSEFLAFSQSTDEAWKRYAPRMDWRLRRIFRIILFVFVLLILDRFQDETNNDTIAACQDHDTSIGNSSRRHKPSLP